MIVDLGAGLIEVSDDEPIPDVVETLPAEALVAKLRRAGYGAHTAKMIARDAHAYRTLIEALP